MKTISDIASTVSAQYGQSKAEAEKQVKAVLDAIKSEVANGNDVQLHGFGKFSSVERAAREGRNPSTGATVQIAAKTAVKFKAAKQFSDAL